MFELKTVRAQRCSHRNSSKCTRTFQLHFGTRGPCDHKPSLAGDSASTAVETTPRHRVNFPVTSLTAAHRLTVQKVKAAAIDF